MGNLNIKMGMDNRRYVLKSLEGLIRPIKVAPIATGLTLGGLILGVDGIDILRNYNEINERIIFIRGIINFSIGPGLFMVGLKSYGEAYSAYFKGLRNILRFNKVDKRYITKYKKRKATCCLLGYKASADLLGYKKEYKIAIQELKSQPCP